MRLLSQIHTKFDSRCVASCHQCSTLQDAIYVAHPALLPAQVLLLDELTTFLDTSDQQNVLQAVRNVVDTASAPVTALWVCSCILPYHSGQFRLGCVPALQSTITLVGLSCMRRKP